MQKMSYVFFLTILMQFSLGLVSVVKAEGVAVPAGSAPIAAPAQPAGTPAVTGQPAQAQPGIAGMLFPFAAMFGVIYFLMIRPQQKKMKEQQQMLGALAHGDEVITTSGILGTIAGITDKVVTVEVASNVKIKMLKSQVAQVVKGSIKDLNT